MWFVAWGRHHPKCSAHSISKLAPFNKILKNGLTTTWEEFIPFFLKKIELVSQFFDCLTKLMRYFIPG